MLREVIFFSLGLSFYTPLTTNFKIKIILSRGIRQSISEYDQLLALNRHAQCDWGDVSEEDFLANENAFLTGERLFSVYRSLTGLEFWVITEADRQYTTLMLANEH